MTRNTYTYVSRRGNNILHRGYGPNGRYNLKEQFQPTLFVPSKKKGDSEEPWHTVDGREVYPVQPGSLSDCKEFLEKYSDVHGFEIYGMRDWVTQFVSEEYHYDIDWSMKNTRINFIDIETTVENGFPSVTAADQEILLITNYDSIFDAYTVYASREFDLNSKVELLKSRGIEKRQIMVKLCQDEYHLLKTFIIDWATNYPDAVTGWNIEFFDIPYLINRMMKVLGEELTKTFSPWGMIREKWVTKNDEKQLSYRVEGVNILDYMALMRKFTYGERESWKLGNVAEDELGQTKLDFDCSFQESYTKHWDDFVVYNIIDVHLVVMLDNKFKLLELAFMVAYMARINPDEVFSPIRTWDSIIHHRLKQQKITIHNPSISNNRPDIAGGYVKEPIPGKYRYLASFDLKSLYPHLMMWANMSPDTLTDRFYRVTVDGLLLKKYDLSELKELDICLAANGHTFAKDKQGFVPALVSEFYQTRSVVKKQMLKKEQEYENTKEESLLSEISTLNAKQMAVKILMNALYGAMASKYFRFFDTRIAEGITLSGQLAIRWVGGKVNKFLNKACSTEGVDYIIYTDTDSIYVSLEKIVEMYSKTEVEQERIAYMLKFCNTTLQAVINKAYEELAEYMNAYDQKLIMKTEKICDYGIWSAKKKYALSVWNSEGVQYKEQHISATGLDVVRSSTPVAVRGYLKEGIKKILINDEATVQKFISDARKEFLSLPVNEIAKPTGVNGLSAYSGSPIYKKGCPINVRAALLYNHYIKKLGVDDKYEPIKEGGKMKFVYLKMPNTFKENIIGFVDKIPTEFNIDKYVDYALQFDKTFIKPMETLMEPIGWKTEEGGSLDDFF